MGIRDWQLVWKMREEALLALKFVEGLDYNEFHNDEKSKRAVTQTLLNIGELERSLTEEFKTQNNHIPWRAIRRTRNVMAHEYGAVNFDVIWKTITDDVPDLIRILETVLNEYTNLGALFDADTNNAALLKAIGEADNIDSTQKEDQEELK
jgi:uncharacterized protein with HEPN domain